MPPHQKRSLFLAIDLPHPPPPHKGKALQTLPPSHKRQVSTDVHMLRLSQNVRSLDTMALDRGPLSHTLLHYLNSLCKNFI